MNSRKHRKCPHCKSKSGFKIEVQLGGTMEFKVEFSGKIIDTQREGVDNMDDYAYCINCNKSIPAEKVDTNLV